MHGVNTGAAGEEDDLAIAKQLMRTCYEMYARSPSGLAPEIVHFTQHNGDNEYPKAHAHDVGGGDFTIKPQVGARRCCWYPFLPRRLQDHPSRFCKGYLAIDASEKCCSYC